MNATKNVTLENKYIIHKIIGEGAHGTVFSAKNINTNEDVVVKIDSSILLKNEARIYRLFTNTKGIPNMRSFGKEGDYNYIVMDKLGMSLEDLFQQNKGGISLQKVIMIGIQLIKRIQSVHLNNIIHRDVKPENFMLGASTRTQNIVHIIDFGLSKLYSIQGKHVEMKTARSPIGTLDYISLNVHCGCTPSRRDDMESIGYILLYLLGGKLPWMESLGKKRSTTLSGNQEESVERKIYEIKNSCMLWNIRVDNDNDIDIPGEFITFIQYCRSLKYDQMPDYNYLSSLLTNLFKMKRFSIEQSFFSTTTSPQ